MSNGPQHEPGLVGAGVSTLNGRVIVTLAVMVFAGVVALAWFGYRAADEWQQSSARLVERRERAVIGQIALTVYRDMRAVQASVLSSRGWDTSESSLDQDAIDMMARAFGQYAYPEVFFTYDDLSLRTQFFGRGDRLPNWRDSNAVSTHAGVVVFDNSPAAEVFQDRLRRDLLEHRQYSIFEAKLDGVPYQVVARPALSHHSNLKENQDRFAVLNRYHVSMFTYLLEKLQATPDGDGTLLDHSMVLYGSGMSDGNQHNHEPLPLVLAGGASGQLETGRRLRNTPGTTMSNLLVSIANLMGVPTEEFGDSTGVLEL